jgi:hypothetical protein
VHVFFSAHMRHGAIAPGRSTKIAEALCELARDWLHCDASYATLKPGERIPEVSQVSVTRGGSGWRKRGPSWVRPPLIEEIESLINQKNASYRTYRESCDECWLLIATSWNSPAQGFTLDSRAAKPCCLCTCAFDRVFILEECDQTLIELSTGAARP